MRPSRSAFTLFELILAIALAAVLLTLIGTAINLYLMRIDADRTRVEEAQLARSVLTMIADDIRAASIYQKQDVSAIAALMANSKPYDVDDVDKLREGGPGIGAPGGANKIAAIASSVGKAGSANAAGGAPASGAGSSSSSSSGVASEESDETMPLGVSGTVADLYVDVTRMPRQEELFATVTGYTNAPQATGSNPGASGSSGTSTGADVNPPADLKTVHYMVRPGNTIEAGSAAATSLAPAAQASAGGLVRQEVPRTMRVFGEQQGTSAIDSGGVLIAPEVTQIQFRYYDGSQLVDTWDMKELKKLPTAIEVSIWLRSNRAVTSAAEFTSDDALGNSRQYRQVVYLPMSQLAADAAATTGTDGSTPTDSTSSSETSSSGNGSTFDQ